MTLIKTFFTVFVLAFFAISFLTFDLAALDLSLPSGTLLRENPFAIGILGGILLLAVIGDRRLGGKRVS